MTGNETKGGLALAWEWLVGKQRLCDHPTEAWECRQTVMGVTLGGSVLGGIGPTRLYRFSRLCGACGHFQTSEGILPAAVEAGKPHDENGWPLDEAGNQLPVYEF